MTLDEAITHEEEVAEGYQAIVDSCDFYGENMMKCEASAKKHRQLAEWLKDYKRLLEHEPRKDEVILTKEEYGELVSSEFDNGYTKGYAEGLKWCLEVIDKYRAERKGKE